MGKRLSDLEEENPALAERYGEAITELHDWVTEQAQAGRSDLFETPLFDQMRVIEAKLGVSADAWEYIDWDNLYFAVMG